MYAKTEFVIRGEIDGPIVETDPDPEIAAQQFAEDLKAVIKSLLPADENTTNRVNVQAQVTLHERTGNAEVIDPKS